MNLTNNCGEEYQASSSVFDAEVTLFKDFQNTDKPYFRTISEILHRIKTGKSQKTIESLRSEQNQNKKDVLKKSLPCICFSGKFLRRSDNALTKHSGFIILDFDKLSDDEDELRAYIGQIANNHPYVASAFISPSGNGIKVLVRCFANGNMHRGQFAALRQLFPQADKSGVNESRICYESYDPHIYINENATIFDGYVAAPVVEQPHRPERKATGYDYSKIDVAANMVRNAIDGERHNTLLRASRLVGGFIAGGYIPEDIAEKILLDEFSARPYSESYKPLETIRDGIAYGKNVPIYEQKPEEQPQPKQKTTSGVIFLSDMWATMLEQRKTGKPRGTTTYFPFLDSHWTWKKGETTLFSGRPGSGKSQFVLQLMLIKSVYEGSRWAVFSPENDPPDEFYDDLIHSYSGMSTMAGYRNYISESDYEKSAQFIQEHFFMVQPDTAWTPKEIDANFEYCIKEFGCEGVLTDPFNRLEHQMNGVRDDHYVSEYMNNRKRFARKNNIYDLVVLHPKQLRKNSKGEYDPVTEYDLANGAMWINKTDNFIVVHRPNYDQNPKDETVEIRVRKIKKQKLVGIPGETVMQFDRAKNRYYDLGFSPLDSVKIGQKPAIQPKPQQSEVEKAATIPF